MMDLEEYLRIELSIPNLDEEVVHGVPIWRLARTQFRWMVRDSRPFTVSPNIKLSEFVVNYIKSFWSFIKIFFFGKHISAVFFPHPRLFYVDDIYLERLSDPLIDSWGIDDYVIMERHQNGIHKRPRYHQSNLIYLDYIDSTVRMLSVVFKPFFKRTYGKEVNSLYSKLDSVLHLEDDKYKALFVNVITNYVLSRCLVAPIMRKLKPNLVFFSPRGTFDYATTYCKQHGSTIIELQHGIVIGKTVLYTSNSYNRDYDPDYFFVFGPSNIGTQYGMPINRVKNIGYPYKDYLKERNTVSYQENVGLVASEPGITGQIIEVLIDIVSKYPQYEFHIRCHPQERFSEKHYNMISNYPQIKVVDNHLESFCAISQYKVVVGEISSVLFEAMSLHKKVARLNYGGLKATETELLHGGTVINCAEDYHRFMTEAYSDENDSKDVYSDYQPDTIKSIIK